MSDTVVDPEIAKSTTQEGIHVESIDKIPRDVQRVFFNKGHTEELRVTKLIGPESLIFVGDDTENPYANVDVETLLQNADLNNQQES